MCMYLKAGMAAAVCFLFASYLFAAVPAGYKGTPFSYDTLKGHPQQIPGVIKCVFWDNGGEGVAFHESSNNTDQQGSGSMRKDFTGKQIQADWPVDMQYFEICRDHEEDGTQSDTGSWFLGWTFPPEWQKHTVHVNTAGVYYVTFHMAESDSPNIVGLTFYNGTTDSIGKTDSVKNLRKSIIPSDCCGGGCEYWHAWGTFSNVDSIELDTGLQVFKISYIMGNWNFDKVIFTLKGASPVVFPEMLITPSGGFDVRPVLCGNKLNVSFSLEQPGQTKLSVFDCSGKAVVPAVVRNLTAGSHRETLNFGSIGQGVYIIRIEQHGNKSTSNFIYR